MPEAITQGEDEALMYAVDALETATDRKFRALCRFEWNLTSPALMDKPCRKRCRLDQRVDGKVFKFGHAQIGNVDEVRHRSEAPRRRLGLLKQRSPQETAFKVR